MASKAYWRPLPKGPQMWRKGDERRRQMTTTQIPALLANRQWTPLSGIQRVRIMLTSLARRGTSYRGRLRGPMLKHKKVVNRTIKTSKWDSGLQTSLAATFSWLRLTLKRLRRRLQEELTFDQRSCLGKAWRNWRLQSWDVMRNFNERQTFKIWFLLIFCNCLLVCTVTYNPEDYKSTCVLRVYLARKLSQVK